MSKRIPMQNCFHCGLDIIDDDESNERELAKQIIEELPLTMNTTTSEYEVIYDTVENKYIIKRK